MTKRRRPQTVKSLRDRLWSRGSRFTRLCFIMANVASGVRRKRKQCGWYGCFMFCRHVLNITGRNAVLGSKVSAAAAALLSKVSFSRRPMRLRAAATSSCFSRPGAKIPHLPSQDRLALPTWRHRGDLEPLFLGGLFVRRGAAHPSGCYKYLKQASKPGVLRRYACLSFRLPLPPRLLPCWMTRLSDTIELCRRGSQD